MASLKSQPSEYLCVCLSHYFVNKFFKHANEIDNAHITPIPRRISSSCGTGVVFTDIATFEKYQKKAEIEAVYEMRGSGKKMEYIEIFARD